MDLRTIAERIEFLAKKKYGNTNKMVEASNGSLSSSVVYNMKRENPSAPNIIVFHKIAELLDTSVDYLYTGYENVKNEFNINDVQSNNGVIGQTNAPVTINNENNEKRELSKEEIEILRVYNNLDFKKRVKFLNTAIELEEEMRTEK